MRRLLILLFLVALVSCHKPPKPPDPTPPYCGDGECTLNAGEVPETCPEDCGPPNQCGNGVCDPGETNSSCSADCPPPPACDNDGKCEGPQETPSNCNDCITPPEPVCSNGIYDKECPPITRDFSNNRLLGFYTGPMGQKDFDFDAFLKLFDLKEGLNGFVVHLLSPWRNDGTFMPWKYVNGNYTEDWNEDWWRQLRWMVSASIYYNVTLGITVQDQYCNPDCSFCQPRYYTLTEHPFERVCGKTGETFYANWLRRLPVCDNAVLFCWDANNENDISTYRPTSKEGRMWMAYVERLIKEVSVIKKQEEAKGRQPRIIFRLGNEAFYRVVKEGCGEGSLDAGRSRYLDDRSTNFFFKTLNKYGIKNGQKGARFIINEEFTYEGQPDFCWTDKTYRRYIKPNNYLYEFHGIGTPKEVEIFTKTFQMDDQFLLLSSDGEKEDSTYYSRMKQIKNMKLDWFDYKLYEADRYIEDANACVAHYVPLMQKEIFK